MSRTPKFIRGRVLEYGGNENDLKVAWIIRTKGKLPYNLASCERHEYCGSTLKVNDVLVLRKELEKIYAYRIDLRVQSCLVGQFADYDSGRECRKFFKDKYVQVVNTYDNYSEYDVDNALFPEYVTVCYGIAKCVLLE